MSIGIWRSPPAAASRRLVGPKQSGSLAPARKLKRTARMRLAFDHGTLVLSEAPDSDLGFLPGVRWDPRVALWRAPAWRHAEIRDALERNGIPLRDEVTEQAPSSAKVWPVELRAYQRAALLAWTVADRRGVIVLPTGSGKTRVAIAMMAEVGLPTLCIVPTRALLQQWQQELCRFSPEPVGIWGDGERTLGPVTVATFESAYRYMSELGGRFQVLVVDEVHHFGSGVRDEALEMCVAPLRLGLTATPPGGPALGRVSELVGPVVYQLGVADLAGSYLSSFDLVVLKLPLTPDERARYDTDQRQFSAMFREVLRDRPGLGWEDFQMLAAQSPEGRAAMAAWRRSRRLVGLTEKKSAALREIMKRHRDSKILVFTLDNASAYRIAREHLIMPVTCDIKRREREAALAAFRAGDLRALVSSRVLNEGLDVPDADVAVILGGTRGEREHVQRIGRLLRPSPGKRALVYELVAAGTHEVFQSQTRRRGLAVSHAAQL